MYKLIIAIIFCLGLGMQAFACGEKTSTSAAEVSHDAKACQTAAKSEACPSSCAYKNKTSQASNDGTPAMVASYSEKGKSSCSQNGCNSTAVMGSLVLGMFLVWGTVSVARKL